MSQYYNSHNGFPAAATASFVSTMSPQQQQPYARPPTGTPTTGAAIEPNIMLLRRRCPSLENGQATFAAATSPHALAPTTSHSGFPVATGTAAAAAPSSSINSNGNGNGGGGDPDAWLRSPAAALLVQRCMTAYHWDEVLARRVLSEYTRFCHLKLRMGDAHGQIVAPHLIHSLWQTHYLDSAQYCQDIQSICGTGAFLHYNHYAALDGTKVASTETALMAVFGEGGVDRDVWAFYANYNASMTTTTTAAAAAAAAAIRTIPSRAPPAPPGSTLGMGFGATASMGFGTTAMGANTNGTNATNANAFASPPYGSTGTPTGIASTIGARSTSASRRRRRRPSSALKTSKTTPMTTIGEHGVTFKKRPTKAANDPGVEVKDKDEEESDEETMMTEMTGEGEEEDDATFNDDEATAKTEEGSDGESLLKPSPKKKQGRQSKEQKQRQMEAEAAEATEAAPEATAAASTPNPPSSSRASSRTTRSSSKSTSKAHGRKDPPAKAPAPNKPTNVVVITDWSGHSKQFSVLATTTAGTLRDAFLSSVGMTDHLPDSVKLFQGGVPIPSETVLSSLQTEPGATLHLEAVMELSPVKIEGLTEI